MYLGLAAGVGAGGGRSEDLDQPGGHIDDSSGPEINDEDIPF